ncbi:immunity protein Imm33 domain-containing protein [Hydrogenispora ethanolica]|uniref:immunity protein Imm33 domain-containing protein n=1 Tax=Hydrogenispora ethanolica TaxID=1082276 RepID=UPI0014045802|nr:DUF2185 domain-containing protein [Hydrogenispora ethanolica]
MNKRREDNRAAIVCEHIAKEGYAILRAIKDVPLDGADSGWQFLCNSVEFEDEDTAQVWGIDEVLEVEPSLSGLIEEPPGTELVRESENAEWKIFNQNE